MYLFVCFFEVSVAVALEVEFVDGVGLEVDFEAVDVCFEGFEPGGVRRSWCLW